MNPEETFEKRLRDLPQRQLPSSWKQEILRDARAALPVEPAPGSAPSWLASLEMVVRAVFWPAPEAWAGLAAVWMLAMALNMAARDPGRPTLAHQSFPQSPQIRQLLREQEQLLADLVGPNGPPQPATSAPSSPHSRLYIRQEFANT